MQDPTEICKASVHHKVLQDNEIGPQIQIGPILILKKIILNYMSLSLSFYRFFLFKMNTNLLTTFYNNRS